MAEQCGRIPSLSWVPSPKTIEAEAISIAAKNVKLLSAEGMLDRQAELAALAKVSGRESHVVATASAAALHAWLDRQSSALQQTSIFEADATDPDAIRAHFPANPSIDIGFADVPYELHSSWRTEATGRAGPEMKVLATLADLSVPLALLATRKGLKLTNPRYKRAAKLKNGHRVLWIFELAH